jgi:predicted O-methyltransferase YrrM
VHKRKSEDEPRDATSETQSDISSTGVECGEKKHAQYTCRHFSAAAGDRRRWIALNCFSMDDLGYLKSPRALAPILARTTELNFDMASEPRTGALLQMLAASKPGGRLLELGTGTGLGTAWLLSGMDAASTLVSVDTDQEVQAVAREALCQDTRLNLLSQDGAAFLWRQPKKSFDLVFADAIPGKYEALDEALAIVKTGGYYVIDDMLPQPNWPEGHGEKAQALLDLLAADPRFVMLPLVWSTGVVVLVRKSSQDVVPET